MYFPLDKIASLAITASYIRYLCTSLVKSISSGFIFLPAVKISFTVILFLVRVPVLSEHTTETHPRLSTAFKSFIMAFSLAILLVPIA